MLCNFRDKLRFPIPLPFGLQCRRHCLTLLTVGVALVLTLTFFVMMQRWERQEMQMEFDYASEHFVEVVRRAIERIELTHEVIRQDFYGSPGISQEEFTLCAEPFLARVPSLKVIQWAPRVSRDDRQAFVERARREGWPDYRIIEPDPQGQLVPAQQRDEYFPIWYAASKTGFQARFGWDFEADPVLHKAIDKCRDTGRFVVSDAIDLSKIGIGGVMLQTFLPVYAMEELKPEEQPYQDLQNVLQASDRAAALTRQLLSFSRRQTVERTNLDANQMVADLTKMLRPLLGETIQLKVVLGKDVGAVMADAGSLQQVLMNLCLNARDAMPDGGEIVVKTELISISPAFADLYADLKPGRYAALSVIDTGQGMSPEVRDRIFEPFSTTKPVGKGTGLGLAMVYGIIQQHEGAIHVYSEPEHGTTFKMYLPVYDADEEAANDADAAHSNFMVRENLRLVEKPYNPPVLLRTIREVLDAEELCPTT